MTKNNPAMIAMTDPDSLIKQFSKFKALLKKKIKDKPGAARQRAAQTRFQLEALISALSDIKAERLVDGKDTPLAMQYKRLASIRTGLLCLQPLDDLSQLTAWHRAFIQLDRSFKQFFNPRRFFQQLVILHRLAKMNNHLALDWDWLSLGLQLKSDNELLILYNQLSQSKKFLSLYYLLECPITSGRVLGQEFVTEVQQDFDFISPYESEKKIKQQLLICRTQIESWVSALKECLLNREIPMAVDFAKPCKTAEPMADLLFYANTTALKQAIYDLLGDAPKQNKLQFIKRDVVAVNAAALQPALCSAGLATNPTSLSNNRQTNILARLQSLECKSG